VERKLRKLAKEYALRKEQGLFCILFVAAWTKRMASGGTRPAGSAFNSQQRDKEQQINDLLLSLLNEKAEKRSSYQRSKPHLTTGGASLFTTNHNERTA
jgi:hypothetical protein